MATLKIAGCELSVIPTEQIEEGVRFREDYGDLTDLVHSIRTQGLINPISVHRISDTNYLLIAGGRRLRACKEAGLLAVPVRIFTNPLTELELRVLELAENVQRKDMGWAEEAKLKREIHTLQQKIHGVPAPGPTATGGWSHEDTAAMLGVSRSNVSQAIALAENMERFESVIDFGALKTAKEAASKINLISEALVRQELVKRAEQKKATGSFTQLLSDSFVLGDAIAGMQAMEDASFDCVILDPPYGIDLDKVKKANDCETYTEVEQEEFLIFMEKVLRETYRLQKENTFCICWFGIEPWFEYIYKLARDIGYEGNRIPGVWIKPNGQTLNPTQQLATAFEPFFIFRKGSPVLAKPGRINVFSYAPVPPQKKRHPTQKPMELAEEIIQTFSFENSKILVPFLGSGVDILAAAQHKRYATGFDLSAEHKGGFLQEVGLLFGGV